MQGGQSLFGTTNVLSGPRLESNISAALPVLSVAGWLSSAAGAQLGYLINALLARHGDRAHRYVLFANSTLEALYATVRLSRQKSRRERGESAHKILLLDPKKMFTTFFNPLGADPAVALCPEVYGVADEATFRAIAQKHYGEWACTVVVSSADHALEPYTQQVIDALAQDTGALRIVVHAEQPLSSAGLFHFPSGTDIAVLGENLTHWEVPFACFAVRDDLYAIWNNPQSLATYTSTFYGNSTALTAALDGLCNLDGRLTADDRANIVRIGKDFGARVECFNRHVHPAYGEKFQAERGKFEIVGAAGSHIELSNGQKILDLSNVGCSLRGHNPAEAVDAVRGYSPENDYIANVAEELRSLTHYCHVLPSVSGAGAVDNAIAAALLANAPRRKIICVTGNYSGKTLPSVNLSLTAPLLADRDRGAFAPYYEHLVYIDPFDENVEEKLLATLDGDDVALLWFELVQGYKFTALPMSFLRMIESYKDRYSYLIGVDEVLTGMFRNGRNLLFQQGLLTKVDVSTMSKATSDMLFPVSWALLTDAVYRAAMATNAESLRAIEWRHRNNFGAPISLNAIRAARRYVHDYAPGTEIERFHSEVRAVVAGSELFDGANCEGNLIRMTINKRWFPYEEGTVQGALVEMAISHELYQASAILLSGLRMFLPIIHHADLRQEVLERLRTGVAQVTPEKVCNTMLRQNSPALERLGMADHFRNTLL